MVDRLAIPAQELITWEFQVEQQGFITRYGRAGLEFYRQTILQSGAIPTQHPVKRISANAYGFAKRIYLVNR